MKIDFDVSGREVVIIDDMASTGTTMIRADEICKEAGAACPAPVFQTPKPFIYRIIVPKGLS